MPKTFLQNLKNLSSVLAVLKAVSQDAEQKSGKYKLAINLEARGDDLQKLEQALEGLKLAIGGSFFTVDIALQLAFDEDLAGENSSAASGAVEFKGYASADNKRGQLMEMILDQLHLNHTELAQKTGVSGADISGICNGKRRLSNNNWRKLCSTIVMSSEFSHELSQSRLEE